MLVDGPSTHINPENYKTFKIDVDTGDTQWVNCPKNLSCLHRWVGWLRHIYNNGSAADVIAATADVQQVAGPLGSPPVAVIVE